MSNEVVVEIPIKDIDINQEFNCRGRIIATDVAGLAEDIERQGLLSPIIVTEYSEEKQKETGKKYLLVAGYRRTTAFKILKKTTIPALIKPGLNETDARILNLSENLQRKDLNIMQEALAIKALRDLGLNRSEVAKRLGVSSGWVQVRFMLLDLPEDIQHEVNAGYITQTDIRKIHTLWGHGKGKEDAYLAVRELKDAKLKGRKAKIDKIVAKKKGGQIKRIRGKAEIIEMIEHLLETIDEGIHTRALAWAAGEITDNEFYKDCKEYAEENGLRWWEPIHDIREAEEKEKKIIEQKYIGLKNQEQEQSK